MIYDKSSPWRLLVYQISQLGDPHALVLYSLLNVTINLDPWSTVEMHQIPSAHSHIHIPHIIYNYYMWPFRFFF